MLNFIRRMHPDTFSDETVQSFVDVYITQEEADSIIGDTTA